MNPLDDKFIEMIKESKASFLESFEKEVSQTIFDSLTRPASPSLLEIILGAASVGYERGGADVITRLKEIMAVRMQEMGFQHD